MIRIQCCKLIIVVSCQLNFYSWPLQISAVLVSSYFYLPVLQPRYSLVIIVSVVTLLILGRSRYQLFQLPINFIECFSTAYLFYMGLQILVVSWMCLFLQRRCFLGDLFYGNHIARTISGWIKQCVPRSVPRLLKCMMF